MTRAFSGSNVIKICSVFVRIALLESSITVAEAEVDVSNATAYRVTVRSEESSLSSIAATHHVPTIENVQQLSTNDKHTRAVLPSLVEAPVEVIGPRAVESDIRGKVENKRETGIGRGTSMRDLGYDDGSHACMLSDDGELKESSDDRVYKGKTRSDVTGIVQTSAKRDARTRDVDYDQDQDQESGGPKIQGNDDEDDEDDDGVRRNLRRKAIAGRRYRQGPKIWDQWGKWTSCSVSCGVGKLTRWRHCIAGGCSMGEKEAQLKTCTFPAC